MFGIRLVKICLCVAVVLGEAARAVDFTDLPADPDRVDLEITDTIYEITADVNVLTDITITAPAGPGAGLVVGSAVWEDETLHSSGGLTMSGAGAVSIFPDDGTLPAGYTGYAVLGVNNGNTLDVIGGMTVGDSSWVAVGYDFNGVANTQGDLEVGSLVLDGARSEIWIGDGSGLSADTTIAIAEGTLKVEDSGTIEVGESLSAAGNNSIIRMGGGTITSDDPGDAVLELTNSASLLVTEGTNWIDIGIRNENSEIVVSGTMLFAPSVTMAGADARLSVAEGSGLSGMYGGVTGEFSQTGGVTTVEGNMGDFTEIAVGGGSFTVASTGVISNAPLAQTGGTVTIEGTAPDIGTSGGALFLSGNTKDLNTLNVSGTADVTVSTVVSAPLVMTGGSMTLASGGALTMENAGSLGGDWNVDGGSAVFADNVLFSGGSINIIDGAGGFAMNGGGNLRIESALNVTDDMTVTMDGGAFSLRGVYNVGGAPGDYAMLTVSGSGTFGVEAGTTITLGGGAVQEYNRLFNLGDTTMIILDANTLTDNGTSAPPDSLTWDSGISNYTFSVGDYGNGYGLYVTGVDRLTRAEIEQGMLDRWSPHPRVDGNTGSLFDNAFVDAVVDGGMIFENYPGYEGIYDSLDVSGKINSGALYGILQGPPSAGYDALMLYNGSGLSMANEAVLNVNRHLLRRVSDRVGVIRREVIVDELEQSETVNEAEDPDTRLYGDPEAARIWAEGLVHGDSTTHGEGFAGYDYRGRGLMIGADKRENDIWYGAAFAYVQGDFTDKAALSGSGGIDNYAALVYAGRQYENGLYLTGTMGYSYGENALSDSRRLYGAGEGGTAVTGVNEADFGSHTFMVAAETGRDFQLGEYLIVTPSAGLAYVTARGGAHEQWFRGAGGVAAQTLDAGKVTGSSFSLPLGIAASMDVYGDGDSLLSITGKAGYAYELRDKAANGSFSYGGLQDILGTMSAAGRAPGRHTWNLGISARYLYDNMEFGMGYDYVKRDYYRSHSFTFSAGMNF